MKNELKIFESEEFGKIRTIVRDGEPWFVGKDVAAILGYKNIKDALITHVDKEDKTLIQRSENTTFEIPNRGFTIINESGLYSLILSSKLPKAREFKRWVTSEVLPSIRKHGGYLLNQEQMDEKELLANALVVANKMIEEKTKRLEELKPKGEYYDKVVDHNLCMNLRKAARVIGVPERVFVATLLKKKYLYRDANGQLMPYANRRDIFDLKEWFKPEINKGGSQTVVTPQGRLILLKLFEKLGGDEMCE